LARQVLQVLAVQIEQLEAAVARSGHQAEIPDSRQSHARARV